MFFKLAIKTNPTFFIKILLLLIIPSIILLRLADYIFNSFLSKRFIYLFIVILMGYIGHRFLSLPVFVFAEVKLLCRVRGYHVGAFELGLVL